MHIELKHIHKTFGAVRANRDINIAFEGGRIVGILGENGAGKSTLMKILSGFQPADSGEIWIDDAHVHYSGPQEALSHGIGMLQQDPLDVAAFTVLENFIYGQPGTGIALPRRTAQAKLDELCKRFGFALDPNMPVERLSIAQRQQMEIIRQMAPGIRTLILDEPTTGISADQKETLFSTLRGLAKEGMTVLLVSHKLEDVLSLCDEVVVLRAGEVVGARQLPATKQELVRLMFGQELPPQTRARKDLSSVPVSLELRDLTLQTDRLLIDGLNLKVRAGEIIGLAGLDGSGQELIMRACAGLAKPRSGVVSVRGKDVTNLSYRDHLQHGVVFGAAGRLEEGLIAGLTLVEHFALAKETGRTINRNRARQTTSASIKHYDIRGKADDTIESLSGGNQQRVLIAMLPDTPAVMILEQPTRGLDVDSSAWIWQQLVDKCQAGSALLFSSADLDELVTYSDRIIVCYAGRIHIVDDLAHMTVNRLGHLIGGEFESIGHGDSDTAGKV